MAKSKKKAQKRTSRPLVLGYLEQISSSVFSKFSGQVTSLVGKRHGIYALYRNSKLYYIGLATNLRSRVKHHLKDKHAGKWNKFSLYLVRKVDHIRELETIVMRMASPAGNTTRGRLPRAENLKFELLSRVKLEQKRQISKLVGERVRRDISRVGIKRKKGLKRAGGPVLAPYIKKNGFRLRGRYKGQDFVAKVYRSGSIGFQGAVYNSPSVAGQAARNRSTNGWTF